MIKVSVFYPNGEGTTFDHEYYKTSHVPMCVEAWSPIKAEIDKGLDDQPNAAAVHIYFDSMDAVGAAMGSPKTADIMADVANYTNITPVLQMSEVVS
jgi:uncharacterized protein (TIGR02118 family)